MATDNILINVGVQTTGVPEAKKQVDSMTDSEKKAREEADKMNKEIAERQKLLGDAGTKLDEYVNKLRNSQKAAVGAFGTKQLKDFEAQATKSFKTMISGAQKGTVSVNDFNKSIHAMVTGGLTEAGVSIVEFKTALQAAGMTMEDFVDTIQGNVVGELGDQFQQVEGRAVSMKTRLRELSQAMQVMEANGIEDSQAFMDMAIEAGQLQDQIGDTAERIRALSSDTKGLDTAVEGIRMFATGFQLAEGAVALFGEENEDMQKALVKLNALMAVTNSLKEVENFLRGQSILKIQLETAAQKVYAFAVGTSTGAMKAFRIALLATGIGAVIAIIALAAKGMYDYAKSIEDANWKAKLMTEMNKEISESAGKETADLKILKAQVESTNVPMETRLQIVKDLKEEYPDYFAKLTNEQILTGKVGNAYDLTAASILRKARANAAAAQMEKLAAENLQIELDLELKAAEANKKLAEAKDDTATVSGGTAGTGGNYGGVSKEAKQKQIKENFQMEKDAARDSLRLNGEKMNFLLKATVDGARGMVEIDKKKEEKIKDDSKEKEKERLALIEADKKARDEAAKVIIEGEIEKQKAILENEKNGFALRAAAAGEIVELQYMLINLQKRVALEAAKTEGEKILALTAEMVAIEGVNAGYTKTIALLKEQMKATVLAKPPEAIADAGEPQWLKDARAHQDKLTKTYIDGIEKRKKKQDEFTDYMNSVGQQMVKTFGDNAATQIFQQATDVKKKLDDLNAKHDLGQINADKLQVEKRKVIAMAAAQTIASVFNEIQAAQAQARQAQLEKDIEELNTRKEAELNAKNLTEQNKDDINKRYAAKERQLKLKAFEEDKKAKKSSAIINGLVGITNALATAPTIIAGVILAAVVAATTAISVAKISAQQPGFRKGGWTGNKRKDEVAGVVHGREWVTTAEATEKYKPALEAMHEMKFEEYLAKVAPHYSMPVMNELSPTHVNQNGFIIDYDRIGQSVAKYTDGRPRMTMNADANGLSIYLEERNNITRIQNKRYSL
jgi:hypothetical protein